MRIRAALSAALLACAMSACTNDAKPAGPRVTGAKSVTPRAEVVAGAEKTPLRFDAAPLWTSRTKGAPGSVDTAALHQGSVIMFDRPPKSNLSGRLFVLDAATGHPRWSVHAWRPLPGGHGDMWAGRSPLDASTPQVVGRGGDWGVLVPTRNGEAYTAQAGYGVALVSGRDGRPLWRRSIVSRRESTASHLSIDPDQVLTDGGVAVAGVQPRDGAKIADLRLIGLDALSGKPLWTRTGMRPVAVSHGYVIATDWPVPASTTVAAAGRGSVTVLDERTGRTLWSLRDRIAAADMAATAGGLLLVRDQRDVPSTRTPIVLDLATGTEIGRMPKDTIGCAADGTGLIACSVSSSDSRLYTILSAERRIRVAGRTEPKDGPVRFVQDGRIYYPGQEVDRSGTPLSGHVPDGILEALDDRYAVFRDPTTVSYRVYRVG